MFERADQVGEELLREIVFRAPSSERDKHRMLDVAEVHGLQLAAPPGEQTQAFGGVANFVAQIVRPAAERIHVIEILVQALRQQETDHMEIFVVMRGQPARILLGLFQR